MKPLSMRELQKVLNRLDEAEVLDLLTLERNSLKRISILERLHMRYNTLRVSRERVELLREATAA